MWLRAKAWRPVLFPRGTSTVVARLCAPVPPFPSDVHTRAAKEQGKAQEQVLPRQSVRATHSLLAESFLPASAGPLGLQHPPPAGSEGAFKQAVAPTPSGTHLLSPKPLHHVASVATMTTGQAEIGRSPHGHVADGTLEREAFTDGTLCAPDLAPAVAAVHTKLWKGVKVAKQEAS